MNKHEHCAEGPATIEYTVFNGTVYTWPCGLSLRFQRSDAAPVRLYPEQLLHAHYVKVGPYGF